jgi:hypothetical protein
LINTVFIAGTPGTVTVQSNQTINQFIMAFFRICQNDTTDALRKMFNATPLKVPEASVQPLLIIAERNGKTDKRGELKHLLADAAAFKIKPKEDPVADVSLEKTRSVDWDFGLKLLEGFFQGFGIPSASVAAKLDMAREISLSFHNVKRRWIDKNELGSALRGKTIDLMHPALGIFLGGDAYNMLLVTDVIVSNGFSINVEKSKNGNLSAEIPAIQQIVNEAKAGVDVKSSSTNSISFQGKDFLTFAFSCVKLELNPLSGALAVGTTVVTRKVTTAKGTEVKEVEEAESVQLDRKPGEPGLLEWD